MELREMPKRIRNKIIIPINDSCWYWIGARNDRGYGQVWWNGRLQKAHRVVYELLVGNLSNDLTIDHLCRVSYCVNPKHLEPVTNKENILRGIGPTAINANKTHCPKGHPYSSENTFTYYREGITQRICKSCKKEYKAKNNEASKRYRLRNLETIRKRDRERKRKCAKLI